MIDPIVFDSSVLVDQFRTNCYAKRIDALAGNVCYSAVVLSELWRGARTAEEKAVLASFSLRGPVLTPAEKDWIDSGQILAAIRKRCGFEPAKMRDLHFDVLIALSARAHGARLITSNRADFELIHEYRSFRLEVWS
jgi:predicted nucleic acid-binding protein